jgi:hypothetical protein
VSTTRKQTKNGAQEGDGAKRPGTAARAVRKKGMSANEATLRAWKKTYENRPRSEKATTR